MEQHASESMTLLSQAVAFHRANKLAEAAKLYRDVLSIDKEQPDSLHGLGVLALQANQASESLSWLERAVACSPKQPSFRVNLGLAYMQLGRWQEAKNAFEAAQTLPNEIPMIYQNLAWANFQLGLLAEAESTLRQAVARFPDEVGLRSALGELLVETGNFSGAYQVFLKVTQLAANEPKHWVSLGNSLLELNQPEPSIQALLRAIQLDSNNFLAYKNLAIAYRTTKQNAAALEAIERALQLVPDERELLAMAIVVMSEEQTWSKLDQLSDKLHSLLVEDAHNKIPTVVSPLALLTLSKPIAPTLHLYYCKTWTSRVTQHTRQTETGDGGWFTKIDTETIDKRSARQSLQLLNSSDRRWRIGYISADYRNHAVGHVIGELMASHDRSQFEIYGYSIGVDDGSEVRRRLLNSFDVFRDGYRQSHAEVVEMIRRDGIDVLIDLTGHTANSRPQILCQRPASIQVQYLGFPGTMGAEFIDYIVADKFVIPERFESAYREKVIRVEGSCMVNDQRRFHAALELIASRQGQQSRHDFGLPEDGFVFCGFSSPHKLKPAMFDCWLRLLHRVPTSVLWLLASSPTADANRRRYVEASGIDPSRLVFAAKASNLEHLARHRFANLFLDTFPYNQHTTASDALGIGLPLLTLTGEQYASRVAGGILHALNLPGLVADSPEEYEATAFHFATDRESYLSLRQQVESLSLTSDLWSGQAFAKKLEAKLLPIILRNQ
jgi:protein O-GlcNAc transferase